MKNKKATEQFLSNIDLDKEPNVSITSSRTDLCIEYGKSRAIAGISKLGNNNDFNIDINRDYSWVDPIIDKFKEFASYKKNWDSYGGVQVSIDTIKFILNIINRTFIENTPTPNVVLCNDGGIQFEWYSEEYQVEIEFTPQGEIFALVDDLINNTENDYELTNDLDKLRDIISDISN